MAEMAIGLIETVGLVTAIEVADAMAKSSNIKVLEYENTKGSGLITVKIIGDVGAVNAAISAGKAAGEKVNKVYSSLVIPRISKDVYNKMIAPLDNAENKSSSDDSEIKKEEKEEETIDSEFHEKLDLNLPENKEVVTCNLCKDAACTRKKGEPRNLCIHYTNKLNKEEDIKNE